MPKTYRFGRDCWGNVSNAVTVEGVCIGDIYAPPERMYYNQATGERGTVREGEDGELHFYPAKEIVSTAPPSPAWRPFRNPVTVEHDENDWRARDDDEE